MIDKKRLFKTLIIISLVIIIIISTIQIMAKTLARYQTETTGQGDIDVAFWVVDNNFKSERLLIDGIYPRNTPFEYNIQVSNFNPGTLPEETDDKIAETDMEYEITITTTTNLPLSYKITKNGVEYTSAQQKLITDADGTICREIKFATEVMDTIQTSQNQKTKITDIYTLKVSFPEESHVEGIIVNNKDNPNYADLMEDIKIDLKTRQKI